MELMSCKTHFAPDAVAKCIVGQDWKLTTAVMDLFHLLGWLSLFGSFPILKLSSGYKVTKVEESNLSSVWVMELKFLTIILFEMDLFAHCTDSYILLSLLTTKTRRQFNKSIYP